MNAARLRRAAGGLIALALCLSCESATHHPEAGAEPGAHDDGAWCAGHGVPEASCTKCNPGLIEGFKAKNDWCAGHGFPESVCPICNPQQPPGGEAGGGAPSVRLRSGELEEAAGIEVVAARRGAVRSTVRALGRVEFDRDRVAEVRAPVAGLVREVRVDLGEQVEAGQVLFVLENVAISELQARRRGARARLDAARSNLARISELQGGGVSSMRALEEARREDAEATAEVRAVEDGLRLSGASTSGRVEVRAPRAGQVTRRAAVVGAHADGEEALAVVVDPGEVWVMLDVAEADASRLKLGQPVQVEVEGGGGEAIPGVLTWIAAEVGMETRTVLARAQVKNPAGALRANQFVQATVEVEPATPAVLVPRAAPQRYQGGHVVFLRTGGGAYQARAVTLGRAAAEPGWIEVRGELKEGDPVVTTGAFLLRTELTPDALGAGCCEVEGVEER